MTDYEDDSPLDGLVNLLLERSVKQCVSPQEAARKVRREFPMIPSGDFTHALAIIERRQQDSFLLDDFVVGPGIGSEKWYAGPTPEGQWESYKQKWRESGKPGLDYLDSSTTHITALLADPKKVGTRKGLVMGNVQSGKTGNFAGVIAKAADAGYKVVIVLAGLYNNLRQQTQQRLVHDVFGPEWQLLTGKKNDLAPVEYPQHDFQPGHFTAAIVKKNPKRLQNLRDALRALDPNLRDRLPILIIDDEADQATPNSPTAKKEVSTINGLMREIWQEVHVGTYLAYTATPFANVLMDPDSTEELFPSDFITMIEPGEAYFGAERVFGIAESLETGRETWSDGLDMVRKVPDADVDMLRPPTKPDDRKEFVAEMVPSLEAALRWFVIATAVRRIRRDEGHSSMLVHTTHYADPHLAMRDTLDTWLGSERAEFNEPLYRSLWEAEKDRVASERSKPLPSWDEVVAAIPSVFSDLKVIVDNGLSDERLDFETEAPQTVIAVGGGTLSRGLTLEGLVVSYFTRSTNTYDTLMQMGRWFGYRVGYEDLPRIWVSHNLDKDYAFLSRVEKEMRDEIKSLEASEYTPRQVGLKILHHPGRLEITSVGRMKAAKLVQISLGNTRRQSFILDGSLAVQQRNLAAVERLASGRLDRNARGELVARGISSSEVGAFLSSFQAHADQTMLQSPEHQEAMQKWLQTFGQDTPWSLIIANNGQLADPMGHEHFSVDGQTVTMLQRTPMAGSTEGRLDFKAVMSTRDWIADIDPAKFIGKLPSTDDAARRARRELAHGQGLIMIYPMSPNAEVEDKAKHKDRMDMPVDHPVLAFGIIFPAIDDPQHEEATYIGVRPNPLAPVDQEEIDVPLPQDTEDLAQNGDDDE